ncbi:MAG: cellulose biosynthesis cyclic di-GMP-binding regulatory protein BcsB [Clostridia bacterium]|nr:cellulose biosynthesis cyclic di-GMP-binding regulatory protein BcsB [Clostridia bacterium]
MKHYLRLFCMLLPLSLFAGALIACGSDDTSTLADDAVPATEFAVGGDFVIILPASPTNGELQAAADLSSALGRLGVTVSTGNDSAEAKNEILVGKTSRNASQEALSGLAGGDFTVKVTGNADQGYKIVLAASDDNGVAFAADYLINTCLTGETAGTISVSLAHTYRRGDVSVAGTPLSAYTVVYAQEGVGGDKDVEAAKYADTAKVFADLAEKTTGVRLTVIPDSETLPEGKLIHFGNTSSRNDNSVYTSKLSRNICAYTVRFLQNGDLALAGGNACSALAAGEAFLSAIRAAEAEITDELALAGEKELIRVACVGDSITYGTNSTDPSMQSYPVYLQRMLGYDYYVEKFGAPSHSLIETDTQSFLKHEYFKRSTAGDPDVVIVMLGTNDCRTQKWEDSAYKDWSDPARKEAFLSSGQKLIDAYRKANSEVQIIFSTCPTVPQDAWLGTDWTARIRRYGNPAINELAGANGYPVIDIFSYSEDHPEMFEGGDGLHPQNEQYQILAQGIYDLVKDMIKKP